MLWYTLLCYCIHNCTCYCTFCCTSKCTFYVHTAVHAVVHAVVSGHEYLRSVSCLWREGYIHGVLDGQAGHGALGQRNDLVDALHHGLRLEVGLQGELVQDLRERKKNRVLRGAHG